MVYLAQNNFTPVTVTIGSYIFSNIPLFYVIVASVLTGLILSYLIFLINSFFTAFSIHSKNRKIKKVSSENIDLTKQVHQLELENERIKNNTTTATPTDTNAL
ncbi:LapA family protein [Patescibacteria group bacterium]|nr:LapA family protein [Patescibacteria group bacterium]